MVVLSVEYSIFIIMSVIFLISEGVNIYAVNNNEPLRKVSFLICGTFGVMAFCIYIFTMGKFYT